MPNNDLENQGWEQMRQLLDQHLPQEQPKKRPVFWWWSLGAGILTATILGYCSLGMLGEQTRLHTPTIASNESPNSAAHSASPEAVITNALSILHQKSNSSSANEQLNNRLIATNSPQTVKNSITVHDSSQDDKMHVPLSINKSLGSEKLPGEAFQFNGLENRNNIETIPSLSSKTLKPALIESKTIHPAAPIKTRKHTFNNFYFGSQIAYTFSDGYWTGLELGLSRPLGKRFNMLAQVQYGIGWVILPKLDEPFSTTGTTLPSNALSNVGNFPGADVNYGVELSNAFSSGISRKQSILAHQIGLATGIQFKLTNRWHTNLLANGTLMLQNQNDRAVWAIGAQSELGYAFSNRFSINAQYKVQKPLGTENYPLLHAIGLGLRWKL